VATRAANDWLARLGARSCDDADVGGQAGAWVLGVVVALAPAWGSAAEPITLRLGAPAPEGTAWVSDCFEPLIKRVGGLTAGRARIKPYWGAVLGDERTVLGLLQKDRVELWAGSAGALASVVPELDALELPFLFRNDDEVDAVLRSPARAEIKALLGRAGLLPVIFTEVGWRSFAGKRPYRSPADLKGVAVRSQESPFHLEMWRLLEAIPRELPITEVMAALETGTVSALDQSPVLLFATSWYRHTPYYTRSRHIYQPALAVVRAERLRELAPWLARALTTAGDEVEHGCFQGLRRQAREIEAHLAKEAVEVVELTAAEREVFRKRLQPTWDTFRQRTTPAGRKLLKVIEAALEKHRARGR
jgi:TRAP-type C4-dicarboxylate transport system substrate-binding protein